MDQRFQYMDPKLQTCLQLYHFGRSSKADPLGFPLKMIDVCPLESPWKVLIFNHWGRQVDFRAVDVNDQGRPASQITSAAAEVGVWPSLNSALVVPRKG